LGKDDPGKKTKTKNIKDIGDRKVVVQKTDKQELLRILAVDDEQPALDLYKKIFTEDQDQPDLFSELKEIAYSLFEEKDIGVFSHHSFELDTCQQAEDAVQLVSDGIKQKRPYFAIFLDVRMPPGRDGVWAAEKIRALDRQVQVNIVIVTAYSDVHPEEIGKRLGSSSHLLYIQKPFFRQEIFQLAVALSENWLMQKRLLGIQKELEGTIRRKTHSLRESNKKLEAEIRERAAIADELIEKSDSLLELNTALEVILNKREKDKEGLEEKIMLNIKDRIRPFINKLNNSNLTDKQRSYLQTIETNLKDLTSSFSKSLSSVNLNLTPSEIQVASLIRNGNSSKEIGTILHISEKTVETHRKNIRKKLGITSRSENLRTILLSLEE
jgi:DNA-binding NarL/FixJ family response regulator